MKDEDLQVYDGLVSQEVIDGVFQMLREGKFNHIHTAFPDSNINTQAMALELEMYGVGVLADAIFPKIKDPEKYTLAKVYANAYTFADVPLLHTDSDFDNELTILYYANPHWDSNWGGETIFTNPRGEEILDAVIPKAGRFVVFNAGIRHAGRTPNKLGPQYRYTIAFKLWRKTL